MIVDLLHEKKYLLLNSLDSWEAYSRNELFDLKAFNVNRKHQDATHDVQNTDIIILFAGSTILPDVMPY